MVFPKPVVKGNFDIVKKPQILKGDEDGVVMKVTVNGDTERVRVRGGKGMNNACEGVKVNNNPVMLVKSIRFFFLIFNLSYL